MATVRKLASVPVSALVAVLIGIFWSDWFSHAHYTHGALFDSAVGLAPLFFGRMLPVALFVIMASWILPAKRVRSIVVFSLLGGLYGMPLDPANLLQTAPGFIYAGQAGSVCGAFLGLYGSLLMLRHRKKVKAAEPGATDNPGYAQ